MGKGKLAKFAEIKEFKNVWEWTDEDLVKNVRSTVTKFPSTVLELACGRGEYTVGLAQLHPESLHIGVDIQGERVWHGASFALNNSLENVRFLRMQIEQIGEVFQPDSIDEIWITFPDPFPRKRQEKKRLTSGRFLEIYRVILKPEGILHLKTDDRGLFDYSLEQLINLGANVIFSCDDIYSLSEISNELNIKTRFESSHLEKRRTIKYIKARF